MAATAAFIVTIASDASPAWYRTRGITATTDITATTGITAAARDITALMGITPARDIRAAAHIIRSTIRTTIRHRTITRITTVIRDIAATVRIHDAADSR